MPAKMSNIYNTNNLLVVAYIAADWEGLGAREENIGRGWSKREMIFSLICPNPLPITATHDS